MPEENRHAALAALRRDIARIERNAAALAEDAAPRLALGCEAVDAALSGGLARGAVHDVLAATEGDAGAALGFALGLLARLEGPFLVIEETLAGLEQGLAHGPGLACFGLDPAKGLFVRAKDASALLLSAEEGASCRALAGVLAVLRGGEKAYDLTASRRLALAAGRSGVTVVMLLPARRESVPSAAVTRWRLAAAPSSAPGLWAGGVGPPAFDADLVRHRGGPPLSFRLTWSDHDRAFSHEPLSRRRPAASAGRAGAKAAPGGRIAAA